MLIKRRDVFTPELLSKRLPATVLAEINILFYIFCQTGRVEFRVAFNKLIFYHSHFPSLSFKFIYNNTVEVNIFRSMNQCFFLHSVYFFNLIYLPIIEKNSSSRIKIKQLTYMNI